jgi:hypothetical protein
MTLREFIECLEFMVRDEPHGDQIEVVATDADTGEIYTPVISLGTDHDGVRRVHV